MNKMKKYFRRSWTVACYADVIKFKNKTYKKIHKKTGIRRNYALVNFKIHRFIMLAGTYGGDTANDMLWSILGVLKDELTRKELYCGTEQGSFYLLLEESGGYSVEVRLRQLDAKIRNAVAIRGIQIKYGLYRINDLTIDINSMFIYVNQTRHLAKGNQQFSLQIYSEEQHEQLKRELELEESAQEALEKGEFVVYLQPKYKADGSCIEGAEALVRWINAENKFIGPNEFIPLFEKNGFIRKLDEYMLDKVCELQENWMKSGKKLVTISVNISRVHLLDSRLVERIVEIVTKHGIPRECIELELTESAFFEDKEVLKNTIRKMSEEGFRVSMDDFGSGYSSLNSLKNLPLDVVKMDGDFFRHAEDEQKSSIIIRDAVKLIKDLDMEIVAEGIEHREQVEFLESIGCDMIQGFYFARPMPVADFEKLVYKDGK
jgi:EAL domain-containing protein (putative c-di-GMP-specific phosphodiesterase class I)